MAYIGGSGALILETQSSTGSWNNGLSQITDPTLGSAIGLQDDLIPTSDAAFDIGTKLKRIRTIHTTKLNDDSTGETLEIGNYASDTGVTGVYGQLQGKGGSWKLSTTGGNGVLGGAGITIGPDSGITYVTGGLSVSSYVARAGIYNVKQGGAKGDGVTDDTTAIQAGIDYARTNGVPIYFPAGTYKVTSGLNWTQWYGIEVLGDGCGNAGVAGSVAVSKIVSTGITNVCHDFSGSSFGRIQGLAFTMSGGSPKVNILLARLDGVTNNYGSDLTFEHCNISGGSVAAVASHSAEVITFKSCRLNANNGAPAFLFTSRLGSSPWSITHPSGLTFTTSISLTLIRFESGEITGSNTSLIYLDYPSGSGSDISISDTYFAGQGSNMYALAVNGNWDNIGVGRGIRFELTLLGSNYGFVNMVSGGLTDSHIQANPTAGTLVSGTGNLGACILQSAAGISLTGNITGTTIISTNPLNLTVTGNVVTSRAMVPSVGTLTVSGTKEISVVNLDYHSTAKTIAGDSGLAIQNTALNKNISIDPTTGTITGNSVPVFITSGGNGIVIRPASGQNTTIGDTATATTWICAGSGASTTTTNIGSNNGSSTNTINIGFVAANDVTTIKGTVVRQPEFLHLALTSSQTLSNNGYNNVPSMTSVVSSTKYLAWDDTNHYFKNNHPTATLTVCITMSTSWAAGTAARSMFLAWGAANWTYLSSWAAGDTGPRSGTATVQVAAGQSIIPWFSTANTTEQVNGNAAANTTRFVMTATVI